MLLRLEVGEGAAVTTDDPSVAPTPRGGLSFLTADGTHVLSAASRRTLCELAGELTADASSSPDEFVGLAQQASDRLPAEVRRALRRFARYGSSTGVLLLRGLCIGDVPATPPDNRYHVGERTLLAKQQAILAAQLGEMIAYEAEGGGRLFQDIVPARRRHLADRQVSLSSRVELEAHTEQAHSPHRPDYVFLGCLRGHAGAATYLWTTQDLVSTLTVPELALAREPLWVTGVDESFRSSKVEFELGNLRGPMPILAGDRRDPVMVIDQDLMRGDHESRSSPA